MVLIVLTLHFSMYETAQVADAPGLFIGRHNLAVVAFNLPQDPGVRHPCVWGIGLCLTCPLAVEYASGSALVRLLLWCGAPSFLRFGGWSESDLPLSGC